MKGNPINTDIFVEYEGKKVYFCCTSCKADFLDNPDKYIADLPQFKEQEN
ncbi:MAG: YHS domain-containing protein [Sedimentisphaerales bacterium]|nr:YHS domain-containing protein [Sedimentisphaerales bacterium]